MLQELSGALPLRHVFSESAFDRLADAERTRRLAQAEPSASKIPGYKRNHIKLARRKELVRYLRLRGKTIRGEQRMAQPAL